MAENEWYKLEQADAIDSPALLIYTDRVKQNIRQVLSMIDKPERLRPHVKTNKSGDAVKLMLELGITKFKCATIAEAEMLALVNAPDVLLAMPLVGPKADRLISLIETYPQTHFSCLLDHSTAALSLAEKAQAAGIRIDVYVDLNVGMNRTGILPDEHALILYRLILGQKSLHAKGLHAYDGHLHDRNLAERRIKVDTAFLPVFELLGKIKENGWGAATLIAGGTPTFPIHLHESNTECSPGTFIFWDEGYSLECPEQAFLPAALLLTRIVSIPGPGKICVDLGHKSVASEKDIFHRVSFLNDPDLRPLSQSEEHLVLENIAGHSYKPGDILYGLPYHICPSVALYEKGYAIKNGNLEGEWKINARDRKITI